MQSVTVFIPHGVVLLYDPTMLIDVPSDTGSAPILATRNCVSIWTIGEDEGEVELRLIEIPEPAEGDLVFDGILQTLGRQIAFNDSACNPILLANAPGLATRVRVYTNATRYPTKVSCLVGE
jgi:hypothetical protein